MSRIGVVTALATEARALGALPRRAESLTALPDGTLLAISGVGYEAAARAAQALVGAGAIGLISCGLAGGLDPGLAAGAWVLPREIRSQGQSGVSVDGAWHQHVLRSLPSMQAVATGALWSSRTPVVTVDVKRRLFTESGAVAVEMEAMAVAQIASTAAIPFLAIKVIVDTALDVLPRAVMAVDSAGRIQAMKLAGMLLRYPNEIIALIRLARRYGPAQRSLRAIAGVSALHEPTTNMPTADVHG